MIRPYRCSDNLRRGRPAGSASDGRSPVPLQAGGQLSWVPPVMQLRTIDPRSGPTAMTISRRRFRNDWTAVYFPLKFPYKHPTAAKRQWPKSVALGAFPALTQMHTPVYKAYWLQYFLCHMRPCSLTCLLVLDEQYIRYSTRTARLVNNSLFCSSIDHLTDSGFLQANESTGSGKYLSSCARSSG